MDLAILPVNHETESQELVGFLMRVNPSLSHETRFDWLYRHPPGGNPRSWFLIDRKTGSAVGAASVFPRFLMVGHRLLRCGQVGDFAVDAAYRTLGPALMLQRATLEPVKNGELDVCYDCPPHALGMSTFLRLG